MKNMKKNIQKDIPKDTAAKELPFSFIRSALFTVLITWFILSCVIINARIPSASMEQTIMTGDRVIGLRFMKDCKRGDIVIFHDPNREGRYLIKRVIGLPGEKLEIKQGTDGIANVFVNGQELAESYLAEPMFYMEDFEITLPENGYFMMGDNRNHSFDARYWERKVIYSDEIIGIAKFRYWPISQIGPI